MLETCSLEALRLELHFGMILGSILALRADQIRRAEYEQELELARRTSCTCYDYVHRGQPQTAVFCGA